MPQQYRWCNKHEYFQNRGGSSRSWMGTASCIGVGVGFAAMLPVVQMEASPSPDPVVVLPDPLAERESVAGKFVVDCQTRLQKAIKQMMMLVAKLVDRVNALFSQLQQTLQASTAPAIAETQAAFEAPVPAKKEEISEAVREQQSFYNQYGYLIIGGSILGKPSFFCLFYVREIQIFKWFGDTNRRGTWIAVMQILVVFWVGLSCAIILSMSK